MIYLLFYVGGVGAILVALLVTASVNDHLVKLEMRDAKPLTSDDYWGWGMVVALWPLIPLLGLGALLHQLIGVLVRRATRAKRAAKVLREAK